MPLPDLALRTVRVDDPVPSAAPAQVVQFGADYATHVMDLAGQGTPDQDPANGASVAPPV